MKGGVAGTRNVGTLRVGDLLSALPSRSSSKRRSSKKPVSKKADTMKGVRKTHKKSYRKRLTAPSKKQRRQTRVKKSDDAFAKLFSGMGF